MATIIQRNWQKHIWHLKCHYQNKSWTLNPDAGQALYTQGLFRSQLWMLHYITGPFTLSNSVPLWNYSWMWKPFCFTVERTESPFLLPLSLTSAPPRHSGKGGGNDIGELFTGGWPALIWQKNKASLTFYPEHGRHLSRTKLILSSTYIVPLVRATGVDDPQSVIS